MAEWDVVGEEPARKPVVRAGAWDVVGEEEHQQPAPAPQRSAQDYVFDLATRVRQGTRNVVGGLAGLPVDIANLVTEPTRLAARGGDAVRGMLGMAPLDVPLAHGIPALQQPDVVQGIRESGNINNAIDAAEHLSPMAEQQAQEFQSQDGLLASLGYLAQHPGYAGTEAAAQLPQFLQIAPGSTLGTIALQGASAASQNNQQIGDTMRAEGASEQQIADTLADAYTPSLLGNTLLPALVPGGSAIERMLAGRAGKEALKEGGSKLGRVLTDFLGETGTEGAQEALDQVVQNAATGHPLTEQVGQNAALGALIGAPGGAFAGAHEALVTPQRQAAPLEAEPAPQTNAIDPALLERGNAQLADAAPADIVQAISDAVAPAKPTEAQAQGIESIFTPEVLAALGLPTTQPARTETPPAPLPIAEPSGQDHREVAARMRQSAQERAAQQTTANTVQPPAPVAGSGRAGGDLAPVEVGARTQEQAMVPPERFSPSDLRGEIGWSQEGGRLVRAAPDDRTLNDEERAGIVAQPKGDVIGRTTWVGHPAPDGTESVFWRNRPDKGLSIAKAHEALDKFERGEKLRPIEQRFVDHAQSVARDYDRMVQDQLDEQQSWTEGERQSAFDAIRNDHANDVADADQHEALSLYDLAHRAARAGVDDIDVAQATNEPDKAYAARLWGLIAEAEQNGTDTRATGEDRAGRDQGREGGQEPAAEPFALEQPAAEETQPAPRITQQGLFAPPSGRELAADAQRRADNARNGLGRDLVRPEQGAGDLLAGKRPEQASVPARELSESDLTESEREVRERAHNANIAREKAAELSRAQGERDAQDRGFTEAIGKVLGDQADRVEFVRDENGLPDSLREGVQNRNAERATKGAAVRTAAVYDPTSQRVFILTSVVKSADRAAWNALHEIAGHDGLRKLLGPKLDRALEIALQNPTVKAVGDAIAAERKIDTKTQRGRLLAAEEALAELAAAVGTGDFDSIGTRYGVDVPEGVRATLQRAIENFIRRLKDMLDDLFGRHVFTDEDVRALLDAARHASKGEAETAGAALDSVEPQTETPAFKRWFGDSKVVDENGKPLIVFHGGERFDAFRGNPAAGAHYATESLDTAQTYASQYSTDEAEIKPLYLRIENPLDLRDYDAFEEWTGHTFTGNYFSDGGKRSEMARAAHDIRSGGKILAKAKEQGYDGIIFHDTDAMNRGSDTSYVFFDPTQAKAAPDNETRGGTWWDYPVRQGGNRGTFDPNKPSILENVEPAPIRADHTGDSIVREGRLLSLIDAAKANGADLSVLTEAVKSRDGVALRKAIDALLPALKPPMRETGVKNAVTDAERAEAGRNPILADAIKSNESTVTDAIAALKADPSVGAETIAKLSRAGVEGITLADEAVLLVHKTDLLNKREAAAKKLADPNASEDAKAAARQAWAAAEAEIAAVDIAAKNSGREWGRFGQFRQRMLREDFTLAALERKERVRLERPLTAEESATVKAMADTIATLQKRVDELQVRVANSESEWAYEHMTRRVAKPRDRLDGLRRAADDARRRLRSTQGVPQRRGQSGAIISPTVFYDLSVIGAYHVANGAANIADFVRRMAADVGDWFTDFKADHPNIFKAAQKEAERATADKFDVSPAEVLAGIDRENVTPKDVRKLIAAHVGAGLRGEQAVIAAAAKDLGLADDEVRALFVQSVPRGAQSLSEAQQELSDLRKLVRLQAEIDRLEAGRPKPEPGKPQPDSAAVAERKAELADLRKRLRPVRDPEGRYQEMRGKQIAKRIAELQARIAAGDFAARPRMPRALNDANQQAMFELDKAKEDFLRHQFEDNLRRRSPLAKAWGTVGDTFNLARAVMTSLDLSAILRQGGFIAYGHPLRALSSIGPSLKAFVREADEHKVNNEITNRRNAPLYKKYGLQLTGIGAGPLTQIEEAYASRWLSKLPWWTGAGLVRGSGRAYVSFLNKLRADSFDALAATLARGTTLTDAEGKAIANYINVATGRGKALGGENAAQALNTVFFAPRLVASRFQLLAAQPLYGGTARTRKLIVQEYARFAIGASAVIALAAFALGAGSDDDEKPLIGLDPRSSDFLKIRVGDTYIDPMAGLAQVSTFLAREATGETVTGAGKVKPLRTDYTLTDLRRALGAAIPPHKMAKDGGLPFGAGNAADVLGRFLRTKLAPVPGAIVNTLAGSDVIGNTITPAESAQQMVTPMTFQNIADIMEEHGIPKGTAIEVLGLLGMGVQQRQESNADQFAEFNDNLKAVQADVKDRLAALPPEQWPQALAAMKQQYGPAMEGVELQTYKKDGKYGAAGEFKRDADGKPILVSNRIADESAYRKAANAPNGDQVHHIIPDNLVRHHPLMQRARELGYNLDSAANLLAMPAKAGGEAIAHNTDHPDYDAEVFGQLQEAEKQLKREHGTLKDVPREELLDAVRQIEDTMRAKIQSKDVPTKGGRLAVNDSAPTAISA